ncbi:MAG: ParB/RepB/Spo0J family partition protein [Anaerolineae bacterium]|nr:ParB/RepB/Spo0J family partition protein [Phycisphaerae bacterium]
MKNEPVLVPVSPQTGQPIELAVESIQPNPHQPRKQIDEAKVAELAASLKSTGVIQPIVVRKRGDGYELIAGERRWRAAKFANMTTIPAIIRDVNSFEQAQMALVENIQREDLNPLDRAQSYRALIDQLGLTQAELANRLGEDRSSVANYLRLLDLSDPVRQMLRDEQLTLGHAKLLAGIDDTVEQERLAHLVESQDLSVRNLERLIAAGPVETATPDKSPTSPGTPSAHIQDLERSLARQLGMRVQLKTSAKKGHGKLIVHYASLDQFDGLLARLGISAD